MVKNPILGLFGRSPVRPLQEHMGTVVECVRELAPLFEALIAGDFERVNACQQRIGELEDKADDQKHDLRLHLPRSLFLPVERRDLLEVLTMQDNIANRAKDIAGLVRGRKMQIPDELGPLMQAFVNRSIDACSQAKRPIDELDELVEIGFRGREVDEVQEMIREVDRIEKETDDIQILVRAALLEIEKELHPLDAMFLYRVIDFVGDIGDRAQRVGSRLQLLLAR
jgi:predicted phosphate transport protein (TIGR00153 family)